MKLSEGTKAEEYIEAKAKPLAVYFQKAYEEIIKIISPSSLSNVKDRNRALKMLKAVNEVVKNLDVDTKDYLTKIVPEVYFAFGNEQLQLIKDNTDIVPNTAFSQIHTEAIVLLQEEQAMLVSSSLQAVMNDAKKKIFKANIENLKAIVAKGTILGTETKKIAQEVTEELGSSGAVALIDKGGKRWQLDTYGEMLARNTMANIARTAQINTALEYGFDLVKITKHGATDPCRNWEGEILSLTGQTKGYKTLEQAKNSGEIFHVNCRHSYFIYIE